MKIVVDKIPNCSSDCLFSRYFSCERRRCILTDNICVLDSDVPCECHKLTTVAKESEVSLKHDIEVQIYPKDLERNMNMAKYFEKYMGKGE